eukprot:1568720-Rhodomonas_salina.2
MLVRRSEASERFSLRSQLPRSSHAGSTSVCETAPIDHNNPLLTRYVCQQVRVHSPQTPPIG